MALGQGLSQLELCSLTVTARREVRGLGDPPSHVTFAFLGWTSRTQFEETWATLLGVLVTQPLVMEQEESPPEVSLGHVRASFGWHMGSYGSL